MPRRSRRLSATNERLALSKILVVDEESAVLDIVCEMVKDRGCECICASSDLDAYRVIAATPSLAGLVTDVDLGKRETGYEVARYAGQVIPEHRVVLVSTKLTAEEAPKPDLPNSCFLSKPFTIVELQEALSCEPDSEGPS